MNIFEILSSGSGSSPGEFTLVDRARLMRLEAKLDLILKHLGVTYVEETSPGGLSAAVQELARHPHCKIQAIKLYREETGAGLKEAKDAVEAYIASKK
jgi:ribosomal protein L7/L12